jgi:hypothetical protein
MAARVWLSPQQGHIGHDGILPSLSFILCASHAGGRALRLLASESCSSRVLRAGAAAHQLHRRPRLRVRAARRAHHGASQLAQRRGGAQRGHQRVAHEDARQAVRSRRVRSSRAVVVVVVAASEVD